ncbi:MAG TPA: DUF899 domain-containing protein [Thermoleophilaceae bacterium]|nr:DUF899 domain-containing protein [Thermoleophilaceae bacterium]
MSLPKIASRDEWLAAREELLAEEKQLTRERDALSAKRRELPMFEVDKPYVFHGPEGEMRLLDLFGEHRQLIVGHFMFDPEWEDGCPSCSAGAEELSQGLLDHLAIRDTAFTYVSRAPLEKIERYKAKRGWDHPWVSSEGSDFNYDFDVTIDRSRGPAIYNFREWGDELLEGEYPGQSCFLRVDDRVFHTYSMYARGAETLGGSYYWLDLTALGRQEEWEKPEGRSESARAAQPDFAS